MNRRRFLSLLGIAPLAIEEAFNPHRVIFDMGRKLWLLPEPEIVAPPILSSINLDLLNAMTEKFIQPWLAREIFKPSPMYEYLVRSGDETGNL